MLLAFRGVNTTPDCNIDLSWGIICSWVGGRQRGFARQALRELAHSVNLNRETQGEQFPSEEKQ